MKQKMKQRIYSFIFLVTSVVIGLGAFGHAAQWWKVIYPAIVHRVPDPTMLKLLFAVWLFASGCMLIFGLILIWAWFQIRKGGRGVVLIPVGISIFYFIFGLLSWIYVDSFFLLFVVLGILLFTSALALNAGQTASRS